MMLSRFLVIGLLGSACGESEAPSAAEAPADEAPAAEETNPEPKLDLATLQAEAEQVALVPSPAEMQKALTNSGLSASLATLVDDRKISMDVENKDQVAVRTGVVLADLVLTIQEAPTARITERLGRIKEGMTSLGGGSDINGEIDSLVERISNDAISKGDLVKELDELSGVMVPEIKYEMGDRAVPLIQAGAWLEGAHLVSGAMKEEGKFDAAGRLLKQPAVVDYFLQYVKTEGSEKAPDQVVAKLEETLNTLKEIANKDALGQEDVETIHAATGAVLGLL
ncbi:MAG: hypothetical protein QGG40_00920 [Myxococcota bacterium]|jgi:hypothetical protein|nr:hypothetical protein [Myxococcota bacterium]